MRSPLGSREVGRALEIAWVAATALYFAWGLATQLGHPLLWHDEADTAVLAQRVAEHGYPKAHGVPDLLYDLDPARIHAPSDAYLGGLWGAYYLGAPGAAWAARSDDPTTKTWRMRLPFALIGSAGLLWAVLGVLPAVATRRARAIFLGLFLLASSYSVSLVLHLREARWYAPAVCWVAGIVVLHLRRHVFGAGSGRGHAIGVAVLLLLLFNSFHPACVAVSLALLLDLLWRSRRSAPAERIGWLARSAAPLLIAAALCLPVALAFDLLGLTAAWTDFLSGVARSYAQNLLFVARGSLRYEFLAAALLARIAVLVQLRGRAQTLPVGLRQRSEIAGFVTLLVVVYWGLVCRSPLVWERYLVPLSPWITLALLLDGTSLIELARGADRRRDRLRSRSAVALLGVVVAATLWLRWPEFSGHLAELRTPVRGPLDFAIPYLRQRHPDPRSLVIATNYEGPAFSFYLGSRVAVGYYAGNLEADAQLRPDVIAMRPWPRFGDLLLEMARRAPYVATRFPVRNTRTNSGPFLWADTPGGVEHFFTTPFAESAEQELVLLERVALPAAESRAGRD